MKEAAQGCRFRPGLRRSGSRTCPLMPWTLESSLPATPRTVGCVTLGQVLSTPHVQSCSKHQQR